MLCGSCPELGWLYGRFGSATKEFTMATSPKSSRSGQPQPEENFGQGSEPKSAAMEDLEAQIRILREEMSRLSREISRSGERSMEAAKRAAADTVEHFRTQGEAAFEGLRTNARDVEQQFEMAVREKPFTALAIAAGLGFLVALMARR